MIRVTTPLGEVPSEVYDWLDRYTQVYWTSHPAIHDSGVPGRDFYFDDQESRVAMLFKLTWGGS